MKVILLHAVPGLGEPGDIKTVADGYARNYLLPRQLVTAATGTELANLQQRVAAAQRKVEKERQGHQALADRLAAVSLTFAVRVGQGERLREQENLSIDRRVIQLPDPIRQLGDFEVPIRVAQGVEPKIKVKVVSADALEQTEGEGAGEGSPSETAAVPAAEPTEA
jgi:large subunit ribosomal protein L9